VFGPDGELEWLSRRSERQECQQLEGWEVGSCYIQASTVTQHRRLLVLCTLIGKVSGTLRELWLTFPRLLLCFLGIILHNSLGCLYIFRVARSDSWISIGF